MDIGFGTVTKLGILTKFGIGTVTKLGMDSSTESEWGRELVNQPDHRNKIHHRIRQQERRPSFRVLGIRMGNSGEASLKGSWS